MSEKQPEQSIEDIFKDQEALQNIVGLFDLLLKIDRRINPELYENNEENIH